MIKLKSLLKELSYDDTFSDFAASVRAKAMEPPEKKSRSRSSSPDAYLKKYSKLSKNIAKIERELTDLKARYRDLAFELEQTAEPEGGPTADRLAREMEPMENKIRDLERKKAQLYQQIKNLT